MRHFRLVSAIIAVLLLTQSLVGCGGQSTPTSEPSVSASTAEPAIATTEPAAASTVAPETDSSTVDGCPATGGQLVVGLSSEPSKIDPHRTAASNGVLIASQVCELLAIQNPEGGFEPNLAESWEISADGLAYTFHLREGVKFQDGTPFNAEAVKYNFDRIVDPDTQSAEAISHLGSYTSTEVIDENTAVVHLESPYAPFMAGISSGGWTCMVSPTEAEKWGPADFQEHFIGTGPFMLKEWVSHDHILLERNPDYWGGPEYAAHQGTACLDSILFEFVGEASVRTGTLSTGEIQVVQEVPSIEVEGLRSDPNVRVEILPVPGTGLLLLFNVSKAPTDDLVIRQALNYGIDQASISEILSQGLAAPNYGALTPGTPCYWDGGEKMYAYDPAKAAALLEEAGWKDENGDGVREKDGVRLTLEFPTHGGYPAYRDPAPIIKAQLAEIGVEVNVQNLAAPGWIEAGSTSSLNIGIMDWSESDPDVDLRMLFLSSNSSGFAWNHHSNAALDDLILQGMATVDSGKRCEIYSQVQQIIMNDAMIKPLNARVQMWGVRNEVHNLTFDPLAPWSFRAFDTYIQQ